MIGLDTFATGRTAKLAEVARLVVADAWQRFTFIEGDIGERSICERVCGRVDVAMLTPSLARYRAH